MKKVLVVNDHPIIRGKLSLQLRERRLVVHEAFDSTGALSLLEIARVESDAFDLVVTTANIQFIRQMKRDSALRHLPIVVVTHEDGNQAAIARHAGAERVFQFGENSELISHITNHFEKPVT